MNSDGGRIGRFVKAARALLIMQCAAALQLTTTQRAASSSRSMVIP